MTQQNTSEKEIRNRLDRLVDRARDDIEYICRDLEQSKANKFALQYADARVKMLETDVEHIRKAIQDLIEVERI